MVTNQKGFFIKKSKKKSELSIQIAKVSRQKMEITDQKINNFQLTKIGGKNEDGNVNYWFYQYKRPMKLCRRVRNKPRRNKDRKWQDPKYVWKI